MDVSVVGTGYVGLVTGLCLAEKGHQVVCVDNNEQKINDLAKGISPIYEKGVDALLAAHLNKKFHVTTHLENAIQNSQITFIAVGTPFDGQQIDLTYIKAVAVEIGQALRKKTDYHLIVVKSTVVPGTTDELVQPLIEKSSGKIHGKDFGVCMNPEFLREGVAIEDFLFPDRIVAGGNDEKSINLLCQLYQGLEQARIIKTSNKAAELIKYTSNSFFATLISFANEIANLCAAIKGVDVMDVMQAVWLDRRITLQDGDKRLQPGLVDYLKPGCGFGGSCFPKDVQALVAYGKEKALPMPLLAATLAVNEAQPGQMVHYLRKHFANLEGIKVGILGLAFKPGTDDIRCSPAISVMKTLQSAGAHLWIYDPIVRKLDGWNHKNNVFSDDLEKLANTVDAILIFTAWDQFQALPQLLKSSARPVVIIDGRRMLNKRDVVHYEGIGIN